jgi:hypothetical protein
MGRNRQSERIVMDTSNLTTEAEHERDSSYETFTVRAKLTIWHTDEVQAKSIEEAWKQVEEWVAEDFTEDNDCSRGWEIEIA